MKFGKQLRFIAVKQWDKYYIQYKQYKKLIKQNKIAYSEAVQNNASTEDLKNLKKDFVRLFFQTLSDNVDSGINFYREQLKIIEQKIDNISDELWTELEKGEIVNDDKAVSFHRGIFVLVLNVYELRSFIEINKTATHNINKKFIKILDVRESLDELKPLETEKFENQPSIEEDLKRLEELYIIVRRKLYLSKDSRPRQEIIQELHKKVENSLVWKQSTILSNWEAYTFKENEYHLTHSTIKILPIIIGIVLMFPLMFLKIFPSDKQEAQRTLAVLVFCSCLWSTSAVPLWITSMSIPFFTVIASLIPHKTSIEIAKDIQKNTMSSTIYLIIGGFTIAAAFKETEMDKRIASAVLSKSTGSVKLFIFSAIILNAFLACWINNIASTMIVVVLLIPTLSSVPADSNFVKLILLGLAAGGNFGGMMTPLASPQNVISIQAVENTMTQIGIKNPFGFYEFLLTAFPIGLLGCILFWFFNFFFFPIDIDEVPKFQIVKTDFGWRQIFVSIISLISIVLWIILPFGAEDYFGDYGIIGFLPLLTFYGTGILKPSKIAELPWNILFIVLGGNALGYVVKESKLLALASDLLKSLLSGTGLWLTLFIISLFVAFINIFVSHTVSTTILLPLVTSFASTYSPTHLRLFGMSACIATTSSQILPVSSFPNLCTVSLQDKNGKEFLHPSNLLVSGSLATIISLFLCNSLLYFLGLAIGF